MGLSTVTLPACEPITLDEALAQCRITDDTEDGLISGYIIAARQYAEKFLRTPILQQTFEFTVDFLWPWIQYQMPAITPIPLWRTRIELPLSSVTSIVSITYVDVNGAVQTLDPAQYVAILNVPVPYIEPAFGVVWPTCRYQPNAITVRFTAGLGATLTELSQKAENVRQAMLMMIAFWFDNRGSAQFGARARAGDQGAVSTAIMPAEIPPGVIALLSSDARVRMVG